MFIYYILLYYLLSCCLTCQICFSYFLIKSDLVIYLQNMRVLIFLVWWKHIVFSLRLVAHQMVCERLFIRTKQKTVGTFSLSLFSSLIQQKPSEISWDAPPPPCPIFSCYINLPVFGSNIINVVYLSQVAFTGRYLVHTLYPLYLFGSSSLKYNLALPVSQRHLGS